MSFLKGAFYTVNRVIEKTERSACLGIALNPEHLIFQGHFPDNPVTPGACMVQMIKELVGEHLEQALQLAEAKQIKFLDVLVPDSSTLLEVGFDLNRPCRNDFEVKAYVRDENRIFMKFRGRFITKS